MARKPDDPHVVGEVFAAELGADAELVRRLEQLLLQLHVAECLAVLVTLGGELVRYLVEASLTVFRHASAVVPPTTTAMWYGGQAAVPRFFILSTRNFSRLPGLSSALVSW